MVYTYLVAVRDLFTRRPGDRYGAGFLLGETNGLE
jgi:hypothetical protein